MQYTVVLFKSSTLEKQCRFQSLALRENNSIIKLAQQKPKSQNYL